MLFMQDFSSSIEDLGAQHGLITAQIRTCTKFKNALIFSIQVLKDDRLSTEPTIDYLLGSVGITSLAFRSKLERLGHSVITQAAKYIQIKYNHDGKAFKRQRYDK